MYKTALEEFYGESRVQFELSVIAGGDILIPDVLVLRSDQPRMHRDVLNEPPLLAVEILSPSQRSEEMLAKCERYRDFGVVFCWVLDPVGLRAWEYNHGQLEPCEITDAFSGPAPEFLILLQWLSFPPHDIYPAYLDG